MNNEVVREALASAKSQPVASSVTVFMIIGMILAVMLTTGRTVGTEREVLGSIDSAGSRSIVIRADPTAGVTSDVLERVEGVEGIEWAGAFSSAIDATNAALADGTRVPVRYAYGDQFERLGIPSESPIPGGLAWASSSALERLGAPDGVGGLALVSGPSYGLAGRIGVPDFLEGLEPLVMIPRAATEHPQPVGRIVVVATRPDLVAPVSAALLSVLEAEDPQKVTVETSEALAELRSLIQGQLSSFSRGLVFALLVLTGSLVAVLLSGLVLMRRKDFGRRRALGATRGLIVTLLLVQTASLSVLGIAVGTALASVILLVGGDPLPGFSFTAALGVLTLVTAILAALAPAVIASRREPIKELRVP